QVLKQEVERFRLQGESAPVAENSGFYEAAATAEIPNYTETKEYTAPKEEYIPPVSYIHDSAKY
ncbi:MAG: hypothetical protein K0R23_2208, partial [Lacrimispora sp.]|nr:hypothetical protein [Lacrimispora sp.]